MAGWKEKWQRCRPWLPAVGALLLALFIGSVLVKKLRSDVWAYYTDGEGLKVDPEDSRARPVLWEDPQLQYFEPSKEDADKQSGSQLEAAFSADGTLMILVREAGEDGNADMFQSRWDGRSWSPPRAIDSINSKANERGPALSRDGQWLYFASDREGGAGGYDLYAARRQGDRWVNAKALPKSINGSTNETGPALSADGGRLYFSSNREGAEDIFVASLAQPEKKNQPPSYGEAAAVSSLNSKAADVQAAMTSRGDHVFFASDRDDDFKVFISRVVDGQPLAPEQVDLYIEDGDVTDPAVRMDGFDLLFSSNSSQATGEESADYKLYRSTTREVVGYTNMTRWEQWKALMGKIAWYILAALAALIALIYLLEKWRDITTLFHKCLALSGGIHLLLLLLFMVLRITQEISKPDEPAMVDIEISIDALAQEELAMESIPEQTDITEATANIESEKVESEFGATGFEAQEDAQAVPEKASTARESVVAEAQPLETRATDAPLPEPMQPTDFLQTLAAAELPEIDAPTMEEREPTEQPVEVEETPFEPAQLEVAMNVEKTDFSEPTDAAMATPTETTQVTELDVREALEAQPKESMVTPADFAEVSEEVAVAPAMLTASALDSLPDMALLDPSEMTMEEGDPADASGSPADISADTFEPNAAAVGSASSKADSGAVADNAMADAADSGAIGAAAAIGESSAIQALAAAAFAADSGTPVAAAFEPLAPGALPEVAMLDALTPTLEEAGPAGATAAADPGADQFTPTAPSFVSNPAAAMTAADNAVTAAANTSAVARATAVGATTLVEATVPAVSTTAAEGTLPPAALPALALGGLPQTELLDPTLPTMEEGSGQPAATPADASGDTFSPAAAVPGITSNKSSGQTVADAAERATGNPASIAASAATGTNSAVEATPPEAARTAGPNQLPPSASGGPLSALPDLAAISTGDLQMEEPAGGAAPADAVAVEFKPATAGGLSTQRGSAAAIADAAVTDRGAANAIGSAAALTSDAASPLAIGAMPASLPAMELAPGSVAAELPPLTLPETGLLPTKLEQGNFDPAKMAKVIQKQRGKPDIGTIKRRGGSEGTEGSIGAALSWLIGTQEPDGRWNTQKHGAKVNYDIGGTGLALLCFYGWGERHDQPGKHGANVDKALQWMLKQQREDGYLGGVPGRLYTHAIATIALCEAYGVTKDPKLKGPSERAIAFTLASQNKERGGWRYQPGQAADTSATGWQYMALHSARMAGLDVPQADFDRASGFLDAMAGGKQGGIYGYQAKSQFSPAMVATGMFCRQLDLVPPSHPMQQESARYLRLQKIKPSKPDLYFVYYSTLALYQHQGPVWDQWNTQLKEILPAIQNKNGKDAGSWEPSAGQTEAGGRVISTALSTLSLEVYYRLLPMYGFRNEQTEAPAVPER